MTILLSNGSTRLAAVRGLIPTSITPKRQSFAPTEVWRWWLSFHQGPLGPGNRSKSKKVRIICGTVQATFGVNGAMTLFPHRRIISSTYEYSKKFCLTISFLWKLKFSKGDFTSSHLWVERGPIHSFQMDIVRISIDTAFLIKFLLIKCYERMGNFDTKTDTFRLNVEFC